MHPQSGPINVSWIETVGAYNATPLALPYLAAVLLAILALSTYRHFQKDNDAMLNPKSPWELTSSRAKQQFVRGAHQMLESWFKQNPHKPVRVMADLGEMKVLSPDLADEIRNDDRLSFSKWVIHVGLDILPFRCWIMYSG